MGTNKTSNPETAAATVVAAVPAMTGGPNGVGIAGATVAAPSAPTVAIVAPAAPASPPNPTAVSAAVPGNPPDCGMIAREVVRVKELVDMLEQAQIHRFIALLQSPFSLMWRSLLMGVAYGTGTVFGMTVVVTVLLYMMHQLCLLNLPVIGDYIAQVVRIVEAHLKVAKP